MGSAKKAQPKLYDPATGKARKLDLWIEQLGVSAIAEKFNVSPSTVKRWRAGLHKPSPKSVRKSIRPLF